MYMIFICFCISACVPIHPPSSNVSFDIFFRSSKLDDIHCMVWVCALMDHVVGSRSHIQRVSEWTRVLFFLLVCQRFGDFWWHSRFLALPLSTTTLLLFQWIAQHLGRVHSNYPDCIAHWHLPALLLPRNILLLSRNLNGIGIYLLVNFCHLFQSLIFFA